MTGRRPSVYALSFPWRQFLGLLYQGAAGRVRPMRGTERGRRVAEEKLGYFFAQMRAPRTSPPRFQLLVGGPEL